MLLGQSRVFYSMARDGLLPPFVSRVHPRFRTPWLTSIATGIGVAIFAAVFTVREAGSLCSIGTLLAFVIVSIGVLVLRVREPGLKRPSPPLGVWFVARPVRFRLGAHVACPGHVGVFIWFVIGIVVYFIRGAPQPVGSADYRRGLSGPVTGSRRESASTVTALESVESTGTTIGKCNLSVRVRMGPRVLALPHDLARMAKIRHAPCYDPSSLATSLIVGTLLIAINHGHAIIAGQITQERIFQMILTVVVPYIVSTASSVATRDELRKVSRIRPTLRIDRLYAEPELVAVGEMRRISRIGQQVTDKRDTLIAMPERISLVPMHDQIGSHGGDL
jgi:hypothetical protein